MMFATHVIMKSTIKWEDDRGRLHHLHPKFTLILAGGEYVDKIAVADTVYVQPPDTTAEPTYLGHTMPWVVAVGSLIEFIQTYATRMYEAQAPFVWAEPTEDKTTKEYMFPGMYPIKE